MAEDLYCPIFLQETMYYTEVQYVCQVFFQSTNQQNFRLVVVLQEVGIWIECCVVCIGADAIGCDALGEFTTVFFPTSEELDELLTLCTIRFFCGIKKDFRRSSMHCDA